MLHPTVSSSLLGALLVAAGGLLSGSAVWPMKLMKRYRFEHWWFVAMVTGLILVPWTVTLLCCPHPFQAYACVPAKPLLRANLWAAGWGIANVLCGLCYLRLGVALTSAIITGLGAALGVTIPMLVKGSGRFQQAGDLTSAAGLTVLGGAALMVLGVVLAGLAGAAREQARPQADRSSRPFLPGLLFAIAAGLGSCGVGLAFVYGQGPIVDAMRQRGAGEIPATFAVWAVALLGGAAVSVLYPVWLMCRNRSWAVLGQSGRELLLAAIIGLSVSVSVVLLGLGMRLLGALGASVGMGIQTASWMLGGQALGFATGEWQGVSATPRRLIGLALCCLVAALLVMVRGNLLGTP